MTFYPPPHFCKKAQWVAKKQNFCKKAQWVAKKQNFCKKAQWVAKKLRERGSNAGRRPKKGGGGPPDSVAIGRDWSQSVAIGRDWSQSVAIGRAETKDKAPKKSRLVAIGRDWSRRNKRQGAEKVAFRRTGRDCSRLVAIGRNRSRRNKRQGANTKKSPIPQSGIRLHNVARRSALLASNELLAQIHMQALKAFC